MTALPKTVTRLPGAPAPEVMPGPLAVMRRSRLPERPALPPGVAPWLAGRQHVLTPTEEQAERGQGEVRTVETAWQPRPLPPDLVPAARQALVAFDAWLSPVAPQEEGRVLARIMTLLEHYAGRDRGARVEEALAEDWLEDTVEYPAWAVEEACRRWRRDPARPYRPTPGQFRAICEDLVAEVRGQRDRLRLCLAKPALPGPERIAQQEADERWKRRYAYLRVPACQWRAAGLLVETDAVSTAGQG